MSRKIRISIDVGLALFFIAVFATREGPNYTLHSVIGLILLVPIAIHLWASRAWIRRAWGSSGWSNKLELSRLNAVLGISTLVCILTGIPAWAGVEAFNAPHTITGFISIGAAIVHGVRNRKRFRSMISRPRTNLGGAA